MNSPLPQSSNLPMVTTDMISITKRKGTEILDDMIYEYLGQQSEESSEGMIIDVQNQLSQLNHSEKLANESNHIPTPTTNQNGRATTITAWSPVTPWKRQENRTSAGVERSDDSTAAGIKYIPPFNIWSRSKQQPRQNFTNTNTT
jgi:hypothetical protein